MPRDRICLTGATFYAFHGVDPAERELGQRFVVDVEIELDLHEAGASDDLKDTVNYSHVHRLVREVMEGPAHNLLESLAESIASRILEGWPVERVKVRVGKVQPPIKGSVLSGVAVEITRDGKPRERH